MTSDDRMVTLTSKGGIRFSFDPDDVGFWDIFEAETEERIGFFEVNDDGLVTGVNIVPKYQCQGIASAVARYLVEEYGLALYFWRPDGHRYDDGRHLSVEGAYLANSLVRDGLAKWTGNEPCDESEYY